MKSAEPQDGLRQLPARAVALLLRPGETWARIEAEMGSVGGLYRGWVAPLAAVPAVCSAVGLLLFGVQLFGVRYKPPILIALAEPLLNYGLTLASVYALALVIERLAPLFGGRRDRIQALKLAAYSWTPAWLAGVFLLLPTAGGLAGILGALYGLNLLYVGLPRLMRPDPDRALSYYAAVLLTALALMILTGALTAQVRDLGGPLSVATLVRHLA